MLGIRNRDFIGKTDSYKIGHWGMYPPGAEYLYSYFEARGGGLFSEACFFGLQGILKQHFVGSVFNASHILEREQFYAEHFGRTDVFNKAGWESMLAKYGGNLPLVIRAVPEGTVVPNQNILMDIQNTDPEFPWLTNYAETLLSQVFGGTTTCSISRECKRILYSFYLEMASHEAINALDFALHDFGYRGVPHDAAAGCNGGGHLVNFKGTDTIAAVDFVKDYYTPSSMPGLSVYASEHSIMTCFTPEEDDIEAVEHLLDKYPTGILSMVGDSYNIFRFCERVATIFKDKVLGRDGTVVVRSDSGDQRNVVLRMLSIFEKHFNISLNDKGYKVLPPQLRILVSEGVSLGFIHAFLGTMAAAGWSPENFVFGMGAGLLQRFDRSTLNVAFKASAICVNGEWYGFSKNPITSGAEKRSKAGRMMLAKHRETGQFATLPQGTIGVEEQMVEVFRDGKLLVDYTLDEIIERAKITDADF